MAPARTLLAATLLLATLGAGHADAQPRLDAVSRKDLDSRYGQALQAELGLLQALDKLDRDASDIDAQILRLGLERAHATDVLTQAEDRRAKAEHELDGMRQAVRSRLRAILRIARQPQLEFALSPKAFAKSVTKDRVLRQLLAADRERLAAYRQKLTDLERLTHERDAALKHLDEVDLQLHDEKARGEQERQDKLALIARIEEDRKFHDRAVRDLDAANKQLSAQIATLKEWQERKYTLAMPVGKLLPPVSAAVGTGFGEIRHPRFGTVTLHRGLAFRPVSGPGAAVRAVFWGRVAYVGWLTGYGETVILDHGRGWHSVYAHLEEVRVKVGDVVPARVRIADTGASGSLKGRHLYFEIRRNGEPVDPAPWFHR